jgi:hypothetical protein
LYARQNDRLLCLSQKVSPRTGLPTSSTSPGVEKPRISSLSMAHCLRKSC